VKNEGGRERITNQTGNAGNSGPKGFQPDCKKEGGWESEEPTGSETQKRGIERRTNQTGNTEERNSGAKGF